jgi:protein O-mannosyl-transferase
MGRKRPRKLAAQPAAQVSSVKTKPAPNKPRFNIKPLLPHAAVAASLCVLVLLAWSNSFGGGFVFDSRPIVLNDPRIQHATAANFDLILNHTYWWPLFESGLYRPVTTFSYLFNYAVLGNGENSAGYHWINFLLHSLNAFLVYLVVLRLSGKRWPSIFIAAVWAVHPVLTESVTNIIGRADLLAGLALLSGFLFYLKSADTAGWRRVPWLAALLVVTAVGVFSKESAVAILGVIVLYELVWWEERKQLRGLLYGCAALAPPLLFMWYQRSVVLATAGIPVFRYVDNPLLNASFIRGRLTAIAVIAKYMWLLVWPLKLSYDYSYNQIPIVSGSVRDWIAWIAVLGVLVAAVVMFKRSRLAFFFIGFAFVCFVPVSNLLFFTGTIMAERFLYLPAIGFAACLVLVMYWIGRRNQLLRFAPVALCLIIAALGFRTWERNIDWSTDLALYRAGARSAPNSFKIHDNIGVWMAQADPSNSNRDGVIAEEEKSLAILDPVPNSLSTQYVHVNAGARYVEKGDSLLRPGASGHDPITPASLAAYQRGLQILLRGAAIDKALDERHRAEQLRRGKIDSEIIPVGIPSLYYYLAVTYLRLGDSQHAYDAATYARLLSPDYSDAYHVMGDSLLLAHRDEDAAVALIQGLLISGDRKLFPLVQNIYNSGLDAKGCAFAQTAKGPTFNTSCEIVRTDICKASAELIKVLRQDHEEPLADEIKQRALTRTGCTASQLP